MPGVLGVPPGSAVAHARKDLNNILAAEVLNSGGFVVTTGGHSGELITVPVVYDSTEAEGAGGSGCHQVSEEVFGQGLGCILNGKPTAGSTILLPTEMEVDKGVQALSDSITGTEKPPSSLVLKVGRWKKWARDGGSKHTVCEDGSSLGKRESVNVGMGSEAKRRMVSIEGFQTSVDEEISAGRSLPACWKQ
ncbi:hypothetical protein Q3G72_000901 [Acer saccharum]|nr:hypothetical protein Q3G72_000901 [Acer saccharum]